MIGRSSKQAETVTGGKPREGWGWSHGSSKDDGGYQPGRTSAGCKLKSRWFGPFTVTKVFPYGTVEVINDKEETFKVNGQRLKPYFGGGFDSQTATIALLSPT
ncbi:hypothetical protein NL676_038929 [Syzygium grande]|nr:hypothetical protein NL676_038929 [Syzygium grande]